MHGCMVDQAKTGSCIDAHILFICIFPCRTYRLYIGLHNVMYNLRMLLTVPCRFSFLGLYASFTRLTLRCNSSLVSVIVSALQYHTRYRYCAFYPRIQKPSIINYKEPWWGCAASCMHLVDISLFCSFRILADFLCFFCRSCHNTFPNLNMTTISSLPSWRESVTLLNFVETSLSLRSAACMCSRGFECDVAMRDMHGTAWWKESEVVTHMHAWINAYYKIINYAVMMCLLEVSD